MASTVISLAPLAMTPLAVFALSAFNVGRWTLSVEGFLLLSRFPCFLPLLDQFPELARFAELLIFRDRQFAAEKKITKRVLVQDAMDGDPFRRLGEIDPVIFGAIAVEFFSFTLDHAEMLGVEMIEVFGQNLKLLEEIELHSLRQRRHLGRTQLIK